MAADQEEMTEDHPWTLVARRLRRPCKQWSFWAVLVIGILVLGYLAVWIEETNVANGYQADLEPLRLAYATAILAVGVPCLMQLGLTLNKMAIVTGFVLAFFVFVLAYRVSSEAPTIGHVHWYGIPGVLIATLAWWLANGEDDLYQDRIKPSAPSGGDPSRPLPGGDSGVQV